MVDTQKSATAPQSLARGLSGNAYLVLVLASLCWSGNHIMGRAIAGHVPPVAIATLRWRLAAALFGTLQFVGLQDTSALNVSLMNAPIPGTVESRMS
jgi:hypothetical protein